MFMEIDEVAVKKKDWNLCVCGDSEACERIRKDVVGLELYLHALVLSEKPGGDEDNYDIVSVRELGEAGVISFVKIIE